MKLKTYVRIASILLMLVMTLTSCEKFALEEQSGKSINEANANVTVRVQKVQGQDFTRTTKTDNNKQLKDVCSRITFAVFDGEEKLTSQNQTSDDADFGTCHFSLDDGEYRLVVIAHNGAGNCTISAPEKVKFYKNKMTDTFYYYGRLSVNENGTETNIDMKRAVAAFHLHIKDETLPQEVKSIKFYYLGGSSTLDATTGYGCVNSRQTETFNFNETSRDFTVYTCPHEEEKDINMTISILDPDAKVIKSYQKTDFQMQRNTITTTEISLQNEDTGGGSKDDDIGFTVDDEWGEENVVYF